MNGGALLALAILAGSSSGCATLLRPLVPARQVGVNSTPEGATVLLDGETVGKTPCVIRVSQHSDGVIAVHLDGYQSEQQVLQKRGYWAIFLDLVPVLLYPLILIVVHNNDSDNDKSWKDDYAKAAGFSLGAAAGAAVIDLATQSHQIFPNHIPSIHFQLIKRDP